MAAAVERALGHCDGFLGGFGEALGLALGSALLGHLVQLGLGALDLSEGGNVLTRVERAFDQVAANADQGAEQRQIVDLLRRSPVRRSRPRPIRSIAPNRPGPPTSFIASSASNRGLQGHRIGDPVAVGHPQDRFVDSAVQRLEEMMRPELELDVLDQPVVDHQRAQQRGLGFDILRKGLESPVLTRTRRCGRLRPWRCSYARAGPTSKREQK